MTETHPELLQQNGQQPQLRKSKALSPEESEEKSKQLSTAREDRETTEAEDAIYEALEDLQTSQPDIDFGEFYEKLLSQESHLNPIELKGFAEIVWDLPTLSKKGAEKFNALLKQPDGIKLIVNLFENNLSTIESLTTAKAPDNIIEKAYELTSDMERIEMELNFTLGRGILKAPDLTEPFTTWDGVTSEVSLSYEWRFEQTVSMPESSSQHEQAQATTPEDEEYEEYIVTDPDEALSIATDEIDHYRSTLSEADLKAYVAEVRGTITHDKTAFYEGEGEGEGLLRNGERDEVAQMSDDEVLDFARDVYLPRMQTEDPDLLCKLASSRAPEDNNPQEPIQSGTEKKIVKPDNPTI